MPEAVPGSTSAVAALRAALEETADALAHASLEQLLACEARIAAALGQLPTQGLPAEARAAARADVEAARGALVRCRRLGHALDEFVGAGLAARGLNGGYGRGDQSLGERLHSLNLTV